jgi:hypothetical protein
VTRKIVNFLCFYVGWFACAASVNWVGPATVSGLVGVQLPFARDRRTELRLLALAFVLGMVVDTLLEQAGLLRYAGGPRFGPLCPLWIGALWVIFASTLGASLGWLRGRLKLAALLGAVSGPFSYWIAARMNAVTLETSGYLAVAIEFAVLTPLLARAAR